MRTIEIYGLVIMFNPYSEEAYLLLDNESYNFETLEDAKNYVTETAGV